ncbi:DUF6702 family protein [Paracnuella aquatica]|uniref:DUF6702 family protein n=1 Tax=Paracnuella aquatica TaxID=2268757 RepID=UPI000DEF7ECA|nr:DUF6702 family protein [Paracnuella aquatica]RPD51788.1 hypothetical protein DRJ53_03660 [Paracnuella aquatica]
MKLLFGKWILLLLPVLWIGSSAHSVKDVHPFYVSVTEINHNAAEKSLEVVCKVFVDDMEDVLKKSFNTPVDLSQASQQARAQNLLNQYVQRHLQVQANGKPVTLQFIGFEKDSESVYCYLEGANIASVQKLDITNGLLHDLTPDQINIMHVTVGGKRQSTKLDFPAKQAHFKF